MNQNRFHSSDEELLSAADGELSGQRSTQVRKHLESCWTCRARMAELEGTIGEFTRLMTKSSDSELPPIEGARARLEAKLDELAYSSGPHPFRLFGFELNHRVRIYAALLVLTLGMQFLYQRVRNHTHDKAYSDSAALPNPDLTPGAAQPVPLASICSSEPDQVVRGVPESLQLEVFREYGISGARGEDYEIDHLVTPGLGGSDDIRNLWPEPRYRTVWNSYVKDQLEDRLHYLVCNGKVTLAIAQHDIANDWISAYRKYFHTENPLLTYSISGD